MRKLDDELVARFGRNGLVVANAEEKGKRAERLDLVLDEIGPLAAQIITDRHRVGNVLGFVQHVFVKSVSRAQVAEVPVEGGVMLQGVGGDGGHHHVAAVARVTGSREAPGGVRRLLDFTWRYQLASRLNLLCGAGHHPSRRFRRSGLKESKAAPREKQNEGHRQSQNIH